MKHLVFGSGLIGGFLAGNLINTGADTVLIGREKHQRDMANGLTVSELRGHSAAIPPPDFLRSDDLHSEHNVVWLTVKCTAVAACIESLKPLVSPNTLIVCCQNGFGSDAFVRNAFPNNIVLNAVVGFNVSQESGSHLHRSTDGALMVEAHPCLNDTVNALNGPLMRAHASTSINAERWAKLQLNLANPVNALADVPTKTMTEDADYRRVIVALMRELLAVTQAMSLTLPKLTAVPAVWLPTVMGLPNWLYLRLAQKTLAIDPTARVSMWWDLSQGKPTEIEYLNQAIVKQGEKLGVACPYNERIVRLIQRVENGELAIGMSGVELQQQLGLQ